MFPGFYMGSEQQDPGPHGCLAIAILTDPSLQSQQLIFKSFREIEMISFYNFPVQKQ